MMSKYIELSVKSSDTVLYALKKMDEVKRKLLIVEENGKFFSLLSIGDIQRAIISGIDLNLPVGKITREEINIAYNSDDISQIKDRMKLKRNEFMPILSRNNEIVDVIFWEDIIAEDKKVEQLPFKLPVVIMAGGRGERLKPLTNVLPKPLIPISDKSIIEEIIKRFADAGCDQFFISINYKSEMIQHYLDSVIDLPITINYLKENQPLGTAGALHMLSGVISSTFFVSNCDILIDQEIFDIYKYHQENRNKITIVSALKHYHIPYGTLSTGISGKLIELSEKPELTFQINSGFYILEPELLAEIPADNLYHITDLINKVKMSGERIGVFPVSEASWKDIGNWNEYIRNISHV